MDDRTPAPALQVVAGAVIGVHEPDGRSWGRLDSARFLAQIAVVGEGGQQTGANRVLGLDIGLGLVVVAPRPPRPMEIVAQDVAGSTHRRHRHLECTLVGHEPDILLASTGTPARVPRRDRAAAWPPGSGEPGFGPGHESRQASTGCGGYLASSGQNTKTLPRSEVT